MVVLEVNPWDVSTLTAMATAWKNIADASEEPSYSRFADCSLFYAKWRCGRQQLTACRVAVDLVMLIMNDNGMNQLLSAKFKIGGSASASAGPVGRQAAADTSWKMNSEILTYSRSRGLFAGATLNGTSIKEDDDAMRAYYGRTVGFRPVLTGRVKDQTTHDVFTASLEKNRAEVNAQAH